MKINKFTSVKVSLKIKKCIWNKRVFVPGCTRTNCSVFIYCWVVLSWLQTAGYFSISLRRYKIMKHTRLTSYLSKQCTTYTEMPFGQRRQVKHVTQHVEHITIKPVTKTVFWQMYSSIHFLPFLVLQLPFFDSLSRYLPLHCRVAHLKPASNLGECSKLL